MNRKMMAKASLLGACIAVAVAPLKAGAGVFDPPPAYPPAPERPTQAPGSPAEALPPTPYSKFSQPSYDWTGFYVGVNGGADWNRARWLSPAGGSGTSGSSGALAGATIGYNAQTIGSFVYGVEFDFDWHSSTPIVIPAAPCVAGCELRQPWLATGLIRFGYTIDRWMPYLTGGVALADQRMSIPGQPFGSQHQLGVGVAGGGGVEFAVTTPLSFKIEYLFIQYGNFNCRDACASGPNFGTPPLHVSPSESVARVGINYRLWSR